VIDAVGWAKGGCLLVEIVGTEVLAI